MPRQEADGRGDPDGGGDDGISASCRRSRPSPTHPYLVARIVGTLDQVSGGRGGWNMVTGSSDFSAQNFGMDALPPHDMRYEMADEYIEIVTRLWDSWEPGAIVADRKSGMLIDPAKVHTDRLSMANTTAAAAR